MSTKNLTMQESEPYYHALEEYIERTTEYIVKYRLSYPIPYNKLMIKQLVHTSIVITRLLDQGKLDELDAVLGMKGLKVIES